MAYRYVEDINSRTLGYDQGKTEISVCGVTFCPFAVWCAASMNPILKTGVSSNGNTGPMYGGILRTTIARRYKKNSDINCVGC